MIDSQIENLKQDESQKILTEINDLFMPELSDEKASKKFLKIIERSLKSLGA